MSRNVRFTPDRVAAALHENNGDVIAAAMKLGCSTATIYAVKRLIDAQATAGTPEFSPTDAPPVAPPSTNYTDTKAFDIPCDDVPEIPTANPDWIARPWYNDMRNLLKLGLIVGLTGNAGCGKTEGARQHAAERGVPFYRASVDTTEGFRRMFGRISLRDARTYFVESLCLKTLRGAAGSGAVLLIDEITKADPARGALLHELLDTRTVVITEAQGGRGEVLRIPESVDIITAGNPPTNAFTGTHRQNAALVNRMAVVNVPNFSETEYRQLLETWSRRDDNTLTPDVLDTIAHFFGEATTALDRARLQISVRNLSQVYKACNAGFSLGKAIQYALTNQASFIGDTEAADVITALCMTNGIAS